MTTPLPFSWPYLLLFWLVYLWVLMPEFRVASRATHDAKTSTEDRGSLRFIGISLALAAAAGFSMPFLAPQAALPGSRYGWFFVGVALLVVGGYLRRHCFRVLDDFFTGEISVQADHRVIDSGAYRWVRHPSYSAALMIVLGTGVSFANYLSVVIPLVLAFPSYVYRSSVEEGALLSALGEPYARFMASRKRFIPFIY